MTGLSYQRPTAKKEYICDACREWDNSGYGQFDVSHDDWLIVQAAKADRWRILPGQKYIKVKYADDGTIKVYRARPDMDELCQRLELFDE